MNKTLSSLFMVFVVTLSLMIGLTTAAGAQESVLGVDSLLAPWLPTITAIAVTLLTGIGAWLSAWIKRKTGLQIEFFHRDTFQTAVDNAAGYIMSQSQGMTIDLRHPLVRDAVVMVNDGAHDALVFFGLGEDQIAKRILARLGIHQHSEDYEADKAVSAIEEAQKTGKL